MEMYSTVSASLDWNNIIGLWQRGRMKTEQTDIFSSSPAPAGRREDGMSNPLELVKPRLEVAGQKLSNH
jgi:hypothetical protein